MKAKKLIEILLTFNPNADVTTTFSEDILVSYIDANGKYTKENTPIIFIEPFDCTFCKAYDSCKQQLNTKNNKDNNIKCELINNESIKRNISIY